VEFTTVVVVGAIVCGLLGSWVASQKRRGGGEGCLLGFLFGPFGVLIEAILPTIVEPPPLRPLTEAQIGAVEEQQRREKAQKLASERWVLSDVGSRSRCDRECDPPRLFLTLESRNGDAARINN
jgi:hypothetical protein